MADIPTPLPGTLPAAAPSPPTRETLTPVQAALRAAELRASAPPINPPTTSASAHSVRTWDPTTFNPPASDKLPLHRILDAELLPKTSKTQAVKTLEMLLTITNNILDPPVPQNASKYRQMRLNNSLIVRNIVDVPGAFDYLIACGFRKSIVEFVPYLNFPPAPSAKTLHSLRVGNHVLNHVIVKARAAEEREKRYRESEKEVEAARKAKTMLGFEEDRRLKREKDEREKIVRDSRLAREAEEAKAAAQLAREEAENEAIHDRLSGPSDAASTMDVDPESGDLPPSYNSSLHGTGRVLGTGAVVGGHPPGHVNMVNRQDLEEDEDDDEEGY